MSSTDDVLLNGLGELPVKVIGCKVVDSAYGGMTYMNFVALSGERYFWRASGMFEIAVGSEVLLSGEIDDSTGAQNDPGSTRLTRCTVNGHSSSVLEVLYPPVLERSHGADEPLTEPSSPFHGRIGTAWGAMDRGMSAVSRVLMVLLGLSVLIPFIGMLIGAVVIPVLIILAIVLAVRRARRAETVQYGNGIVTQNLVWTLVSLGIAVVCLVMQVGFLIFVSAVAGG